jgi:hypothetical protein
MRANEQEKSGFKELGKSGLMRTHETLDLALNPGFAG